MLNIKQYVAENEYLSKFDWDISVVNHTAHQTSRTLVYPQYNVSYGEGIYIFITHDGQVLYVGQSGDLLNRLRFRYKELHGRGHKDYKYHDEFYQSHQDEQMIILTTQIPGGEDRRKMAEEYLSCYLQPEFIRYKFNRFFYEEKPLG